MPTKLYTEMTENEKRQVTLYGCTIEDMRENMQFYASRSGYGYSGMAISILRSAKDSCNTDFGDVDSMRSMDARQAINRAIWILSTYLQDEPK